MSEMEPQMNTNTHRFNILFKKNNYVHLCLSVVKNIGAVIA